MYHNSARSAGAAKHTMAAVPPLGYDCGFAQLKKGAPRSGVMTVMRDGLALAEPVCGGADSNRPADQRPMESETRPP